MRVRNWSLLYDAFHSEQWLVHSNHSINICWLDKNDFSIYISPLGVLKIQDNSIKKKYMLLNNHKATKHNQKNKLKFIQQILFIVLETSTPWIQNHIYNVKIFIFLQATFTISLFFFSFNWNWTGIAPHLSPSVWILIEIHGKRLTAEHREYLKKKLQSYTIKQHLL